MVWFRMVDGQRDELIDRQIGRQIDIDSYTDTLSINQTNFIPNPQCNVNSANVLMLIIASLVQQFIDVHTHALRRLPVDLGYLCITKVKLSSGSYAQNKEYAAMT